MSALRWGGVELHFDVEKGHITRAQAFTDSLNPAPLEALASRLVRVVSIGRKCYSSSVRRCSLISRSRKRELKELSAWLAGAVR